MNRCRMVFVAGTDTGVGKTLLTAFLLHHLRERGIRALAMKPFCSGGRGDVRLLQSLQNGALPDEEMNPYYFAKPVAPLAARAGGRAIRLGDVVRKITKVAKRCDCLLIEGSGGLLVPLAPGLMVVDLIETLKCGVIIVGRNRLGTINHTLLTVSELLARGLKREALSVVLMGQRTRDASCPTNRKLIAELLGPIPVWEIPFLGAGISNHAAEQKHCPTIHKILGALAMRNGIGPTTSR